jgi:hypothetical protein
VRLKNILALSAAFMFANPVYANEYVPTPTAPASGMTLGTGFSADSDGDIVATGVYGAHAKLNAPGIVAGRDYQVTITGTLTQGSFNVVVGGVQHGNDGAYVPTYNLSGAQPIADNFDGTAGMEAVELEAREPDANGSFRIQCRAGQTNADDMLLLKNKPGSAHQHRYWGNTGANAHSTYESLRKTGGTTCGDSRWPFWRTAYWTPEMLDGMGNMVPFVDHLDYYKQLPLNLPETSCLPPQAGVCVGMGVPNGIPNGLRYIAGYNHAVGTSTLITRPEESGYNNLEQQMFFYQCMVAGAASPVSGTPHPSASGIYSSIDDVVDAGCPGNTPSTPKEQTVFLKVGFTGPSCWDGLNLDSPDHRSHVAYTLIGTGVTIDPTGSNPIFAGVPRPIEQAICPTSHPYIFVPYSPQRFYKTDANFALKRWRLSSDEQRTTPTKAGRTLHFDYFDAQSPAKKQIWVDNCINLKNSCNSGALGDGTRIKNAGGSSLLKSAYQPRSLEGWTRTISSVGAVSYTGTVKASSSGQLSIYGVGGFSGEITYLSITDKGPVTPGPITQPHTGH